MLVYLTAIGQHVGANYELTTMRGFRNSIDQYLRQSKYTRWVMWTLSSCLFGISLAFTRLSHCWIGCGSSSAFALACVKGPNTGTLNGMVLCSWWTVMTGSTFSTKNIRLRPEVSTTTVDGTSVHNKPIALSPLRNGVIVKYSVFNSKIMHEKAWITAIFTSKEHKGWEKWQIMTRAATLGKYATS